MFDCLVDVDSALNNSINVKWFKDDEVSFYVVACPDLSQLAVNNMQQWHSAAVAQCSSGTVHCKKVTTFFQLFSRQPSLAGRIRFVE